MLTKMSIIKKNFNVVFKEQCQDCGCDNNLAWCVGVHARLCQCSFLPVSVLVLSRRQSHDVPCLCSACGMQQCFYQPIGSERWVLANLRLQCSVVRSVSSFWSARKCGYMQDFLYFTLLLDVWVDQELRVFVNALWFLRHCWNHLQKYFYFAPYSFIHSFMSSFWTSHYWTGGIFTGVHARFPAKIKVWI